MATLLKHMTEIDSTLEKKTFNVFCVPETRLDHSITEEKICPANYFCHRKDRNRTGGGVAVYVSNKTRGILLSTNESFVDILGFRQSHYVKRHIHKKFYVVV